MRSPKARSPTTCWRRTRGYEQLLERTEVERLVTEHRSGGAPGTEHALLSILMLEVWLTDVLPRALAPSEPVRERVVVA